MSVVKSKRITSESLQHNLLFVNVFTNYKVWSFAMPTVQFGKKNIYGLKMGQTSTILVSKQSEGRI